MNNGFNGQPGYNQQGNGFPQPPVQGGYFPPAPVQNTSNKISGAAIASIIVAVLMGVCMFLPYLIGKASLYGVSYTESVSLFQIVFGLGEVAKALGGDFSTIANVFGFLFGTVALDAFLVILMEALGANSKGARVGSLVSTIIANLIIAFYTFITFVAAADTQGIEVGIGSIGMWLLSIVLIVTTAVSIPDKHPRGPMPIRPMYGNPMPPQPYNQGFGAPQQNFGAPQQNFGAPQQNFGGAPQQNFGAPQQNFGAPQQNFGGAPQQNFGGAPQQNFNNDQQFRQDPDQPVVNLNKQSDPGQM